MDDYRCEVCRHGDADRVAVLCRLPLPRLPLWRGHEAAVTDPDAVAGVWLEHRWLCEEHRP